MRMTIERMLIENFKGTRSRTIDFGASETSIVGMNGTGKTTIPDAFCWVLFNKDSHGNAPGTSAFREKPLDAEGHEIHNLDTTVDLTCKLDGKPFNLRRTQQENWVRKRGHADATYQGNVSTYWINDVEVALKDFKARIAEITSEEVFRLIGSLSAFNAMDWKKRREQLIALADVDVDAVLLQRDEYRPLADECAERNVQPEDLKKILLDQRKRANAELPKFTVRIDEARRALPEIKPTEVKDAEYIIADSEKTIESIDGQIAELKVKSGQNNLDEQIKAIESEAISIQRAIAEEHRAGKMKLETERDSASVGARNTAAELASAKRKLDDLLEQERVATRQRDELRAEYSKAYERTFTAPDTPTVCPTCGQPLPEEQVQAAIEKARADFAAKRSADLQRIRQDGKQAAEKVNGFRPQIEELEKSIPDLEEAASLAAGYRDDAYKALEDYPAEPDYTGSERLAELKQKAAALREEQKASPDEKIGQLMERKEELRATIKRHQEVLARRDLAVQTEARIAELEQQHKAKGEEVAKLDGLIIRVEKFVQDRCNALEESINAKFPTIRWKLFDTQINGGILDVCICMIPCESGLVDYDSANTAAQINADVELVNVLSEHYGVAIPLFVDNSERVNSIGKTDAQLITLAVSTDPELTVMT